MTTPTAPDQQLEHALQQWVEAQGVAASDPAFVERAMTRLRRWRRGRMATGWGLALVAVAAIAQGPGAELLLDGWTWMLRATEAGTTWLVPAAVLGMCWMLALVDDGVAG